TMSIVGEAYLMNGFFGILVYSLIYGLVLMFFDSVILFVRLDNPLSVGILALGIFLSFWGYRGLFALISFIYPFIALLIAMRLFGFINNRSGIKPGKISRI